MRLIHRHRHNHRSPTARIAITQAEITADLHYPLANSRPSPDRVLLHTDRKSLV